MKYKIVVDSSGDLSNGYLTDSEVGFSIVPLTIRIGEKEFVDDEKLNVDNMLTELKNYSGKSVTACPSPGDFLKEFDGEEYTVCITITSKLSGTYNSARLAADMAAKEGKKICVIDSKGTSGSIALIADEAYKLMKKGASFEEIQSKLEKFRDSRFLLFVLQSFDNLIKNGRMKKLTAIIASVLNIKPLCMAADGEIKIKEKIRSARASLTRLTEVVGEFTNNKTSDRTCIITECDAREEAEFVKNKLKEKYNFKGIIVRSMRGLASFYALKKGVIVCF